MDRTRDRLVGAAVLVVLLGLLALALAADRAVESRIEAGVEKALGVDVGLRSCRVDLLYGRLEIVGLEGRAPTGEAAVEVELRRGSAALRPASLLSGAAEVRSLELVGLELHPPRSPGAPGLPETLDRLGASGTRGDGDPASRIRIRRLRIRDAAAILAATADGPPAAPRRIPVPDLELRDVGGDEGVSMAELTRLVVGTVLEEAGAVASANREAGGERGPGTGTRGSGGT